MKNIRNKILMCALILVSLITMSACQGNAINKKIPYGSLQINDVYSQKGATKLTVQQLYNQLRYSSYSIFAEEVTKILLKDTYDAINYTDADDREDLIEMIDRAVFGTDDKDVIADLATTDREMSIRKYVDSMFIAGVVVDPSNLYTDNVFDFYRLNLAKIKYTREIALSNTTDEYLDEDKEELNPFYIKDKDIENTYKHEHKEDGAFKAIVAHFPTLRAADNALTEVLAALGETELTEDNIGEVMVSLRNLSFPYSTPLASIDEVEAVKKEDLSNHPQALVEFISNLDAGQFTITPKRYNNWVYVYKISEAEEVELTDELKEEIKLDIIDQLVTTSSVNNELYKLIEDANIEIYDPYLASIFAYNYESYTLEDKFDNNLVAKVNDTVIKVEDFFAKTERIYATGITIDYFVTEFLLTSPYMDEITDDDNSEFKKAYKQIISEFKSGALEARGFPRKMDLDVFKDAYFHATSENDILDRYYRTQKASEYYFDEYLTNSSMDLTYWKALENVSRKYYETYYSISINHILLTVDYDLDGTIDNPELFKRKLSDPQLIAEFEQAIVTIMATALEEIEYLDTNTLASAEEVVEQFNSNGRIYSSSDPNASWKDLNKFNIQMKVESLGSVTNSNGSQYVKPFTKAVYDLYQTVINDASITLEDEYLPPLTQTATIDDLCETVFGYHYLMSAGAVEAPSAKFTLDEDSKQSSSDEYKTYQHIEVEVGEDVFIFLDGYSDNTWASISQMQIYVYEKNSDDGIRNITTSVKNYIAAFLDNFNSRYQNSSFENYIMYKFAGVDQVTFLTNQNAKAQLTRNISIIIDQIDSYASHDIVVPSIYDDWLANF